MTTSQHAAGLQAAARVESALRAEEQVRPQAGLKNQALVSAWLELITVEAVSGGR